MFKQKMRFIFNGILASLLAMFLMVPMAYAQDKTDTSKDKSDTFTLEEITVTAQKRKSDLQKTPISIQTVTGAELTTEAKQRIDEIMQGVVGVSSQDSQVGVSFYMRGIGDIDTGGPPVGGMKQSAVAVMIDGVYQNRGEVVRGGTIDMQRAEVMRGTQATTLGGSSLAGAVSMVSNNPVFKYEGSGSLGIGNYHLVTVQGVVNVPLAENQALRVAYGTQKRDGYISSNAGDSDLTNARVKYRWQPTDALDIVGTFNHQVIGGNGVQQSVLTYYGHWEGYDSTKDRANGCTSGCYDATMGYPAYLGHLDGAKYDQRDNPWDDGFPADIWPNSVFRHTNIDQYSAEINWDLGIGKLTMTPSYQKAHFRSNESPRTTPGGIGYNFENREQETKQIDMQLASPADSSFTWLGGLYYYNTRFTGIQGNTTVSDNPTWSYVNADPNEQTTYAAYGNATYPILDVLRLTAGVRYTYDKISQRESGRANGTVFGPSEPYSYDTTDPNVMAAVNDGGWHDLTYRGGFEYDLSSQAMVYALYATAYQPGGFGAGGTQTKKYTLDQWTAGLKSRLLDNRFQLNVEGFHSTYFNRPVQGGLSYYSPGYKAYTGYSSCGPPQQGGGPPPGGGQATADYVDGYSCYVLGGNDAIFPKLYSMGADLEINFLVTENDRIDASAEYLHSVTGVPEFASTTPSFIAANTNIPNQTVADEIYQGLVTLGKSYDGLTLQNSPEWSVNVSYSHLFDLPTGSTLTPKVNAEYKSSYWSQAGGPGGDTGVAQPGESVQDAYTLWNAYLDWTSADSQFTVSAYIKNIADKPILTNYTSEGLAYASLGPPRTFGVVLSAKF